MRLYSLFAIASANQPLKCIQCQARTSSDGLMQGQNPAGDGVACFNGTETNEVIEAYSQCTAVYKNEWSLVSGTTIRGQSDVTRTRAHESFDKSKVYSTGHYWKECTVEPCEIKENWAEELICKTNKMIQNNISKVGTKSDVTCRTCSVFSHDREDQNILDCINGKGLGHFEHKFELDYERTSE